MNSNYKVKNVRTHKEGRKATFKRRLNAVLIALFSDKFIVLKATVSEDNTDLEFINHNVDSKTTIFALHSYKHFLIDNERNNIRMDKNIEKWLHTEN